MSNIINPEALLPPGFRFHPTDEELILYYLKNRAASRPCPVTMIAEVDIYKFDPWDLPAKATFGDREWYFFSPRERKYPNGVRPNRAAGSGYWKATGTDKPIVRSGPGRNENIGVKKALVFYKGRPPRGTKTNWIMHEYRLATHTSRHLMQHPIMMKHRDKDDSSSSSMRLDDWVLCRIYKKSNHLSSTSTDRDHDDNNNIVDYHDAASDCHQLPIITFPEPNNLRLPKSTSLTDLLDDADYSVLSRLLYYDNPNNSDTISNRQELPPLLQGCHHVTSHQPFSNGGGDGSNYVGCQVLPKLADHIDSPVSAVGGCLKRQRMTAAGYVEEEEGVGFPPKKYNNSNNNSLCTFTNTRNQVENTTTTINNPQCILQQLFFNNSS